MTESDDGWRFDADEVGEASDPDGENRSRYRDSVWMRLLLIITMLVVLAVAPAALASEMGDYSVQAHIATGVVFGLVWTYAVCQLAGGVDS
jgi:hypothetical protein